MPYTIVLDDGHGMETSGKRTPAIPSLGGRVIRENEFNRAVTTAMGTILKRCGFKVVYSAPGDTDVSLIARTNLVKQVGAHAVISNHYDALDGKFDGDAKDPKGHTVFYHPLAPVADKDFANAILREMQKTPGQQSRGAKTSDLHMTREVPASTVAVLIEHGFMDNEKEAVKMIDKDFINMRAEQVARGVCNYFKMKYVEKAVVVPKPSKPSTKPPVKITKKKYAKILVDKLNLHTKKDLTASTEDGFVKKGEVFTVASVETIVDGGKKYPILKLKSGMWISGNSKHVQVYEK